MNRLSFIKGIRNAAVAALATKGYADAEQSPMVKTVVRKVTSITQGRCPTCHYWKHVDWTHDNFLPSFSQKRKGRCWRTCEVDETLEDFGCVLWEEIDPQRIGSDTRVHVEFLKQLQLERYGDYYKPGDRGYIPRLLANRMQKAGKVKRI